MDDPPASDDGPYADFNNAVGATTAGAYDGGGLARFGAGPEAVAKAIEKAIKHPRARIRVTASARIMLGLRRVMLIGAASMVTKDVPPYTVVAGNPARVIKTLPAPSQRT